MRPVSALAATLLLSARPPDPGSPSIIPLGTTLGSLAAAFAAWLCRLPEDQARTVTTRGALLGGGCGVFLYLAMYLL
jgi:hypothetical protein